MKNSKINELFYNSVELINYCNNNNIKNVVLNTKLFRNNLVLKEVKDIIDKCVDPEYTKLVKKSWELVKTKLKEATESKEVLPPLNDIYASTLLNVEDKKRYDELKIQYDKDMNEDSEIKLYLIDLSLIANVEMDAAHSQILNDFLKPDN